jgi:hypothetical protein
LQNETSSKTAALNENITQQQTKHAALTQVCPVSVLLLVICDLWWTKLDWVRGLIWLQFKTKYMESQALQKNCEADVWLLKAELAWIEGHPEELVLPQGSHSLKILAESRNILIFLLQLYKECLKPCVEEFLPLMIVALGIVPPEVHQTEEMKRSNA